MTDFPQFIDRVGATPGTALDAAHLNALAKAQPYILTGGVLPGTGGGALTQTMPATSVVINTGTAQLYAAAASQAFTLGANKDVYFDLDTSGVWHKTEVANGAAPPAVFASSLRCCMAVTGATTITTVTKIAPGGPLPSIVLASYRVAQVSGVLAGTLGWSVVGAGVNDADVTLPVRTGSLVRISLVGQWDGNPTYPTVVKFRLRVDGVASTTERWFRPDADNTFRISYRETVSGLAAGVHRIQLESSNDGTSVGYNNANGTSGGEFLAEEIGPNP